MLGSQEDLQKILDFLSSVGISAGPGVVSQNSFLPGVEITAGKIVFDPEVLLSAGDILHEAGHVAVVPGRYRSMISGDVDRSLDEAYQSYFDSHPLAFSYPEDQVARAIMQSGEMEAIAWSYAAALSCGINPGLIFHSGGYDGEGFVILSMLREGSYSGINGLGASGMTKFPKRNCFVPFSYPSMLRWLQIN